MELDELKKDGLIAASRKETIYSKGFDMLRGGREIEYRTLDNEFKRIKVGVKNLDDAVLELGALKKIMPRKPFGDKRELYKAIMTNDYTTLREFSRFFYKTSGIYQRLC